MEAEHRHSDHSLIIILRRPKLAYSSTTGSDSSMEEEPWYAGIQPKQREARTEASYCVHEVDASWPPRTCKTETREGRWVKNQQNSSDILKHRTIITVTMRLVSTKKQARPLSTRYSEETAGIDLTFMTEYRELVGIFGEERFSLVIKKEGTTRAWTLYWGAFARLWSQSKPAKKKVRYSWSLLDHDAMRWWVRREDKNRSGLMGL